MVRTLSAIGDEPAPTMGNGLNATGHDIMMVKLELTKKNKDLFGKSIELDGTELSGYTSY